jgi:predicted RNA methylase
VADLGAGTGMYSFGASYLGANHTYSLEIDPSAIEVLTSSISDAELSEKISVLPWDVYAPDPTLTLLSSLGVKIDTVVTNPPFGCSKNEGIDVEFIKFAHQICPDGPIYSIHKTTTRNFLQKVADGLDRDFEVCLEFDFEIPFTDFDREDLKKWKMSHDDEGAKGGQQGKGRGKGKGKKYGKGG